MIFYATNMYQTSNKESNKLVLFDKWKGINKHLHLGSHSLHIPATLLATMWQKFCSHCELQV